MIYMFLSNNPSSGDINLSNLPCYKAGLVSVVNNTILISCFYTKKVIVIPIQLKDIIYRTLLYRKFHLFKVLGYQTKSL